MQKQALGRPTRRLLVSAGAALALAACATRVDTTGTYVAPAAANRAALPRPGEVLVEDFIVDWQNIQLDQGVRARLQRQGADTEQDREQMAVDVQTAIADTLVDQINAMGLTAMRATPATRPRPGDVIVSGQIVKVDAGNATRRLLIGFGAGKSEVYANVAVNQATQGEGTTLLQTYDANANSGRAPGMGVGAASAAGGQAAAAVAGTAVGTVSRFHAGVANDGEHLARRVAVNLGRLFAQEGWIDPASIPSLSR